MLDSSASCLGNGEWYQIVDWLSAESADQMERKLDHEDHQDEGRHGVFSGSAVYEIAGVGVVVRLYQLTVPEIRWSAM